MEADKDGFDEFIEACVNNPVTSSMGGRAFYGHQPMKVAESEEENETKIPSIRCHLALKSPSFSIFEIFGTLPMFPDCSLRGIKATSTYDKVYFKICGFMLNALWATASRIALLPVAVFPVQLTVLNSPQA